MLVQSVYKLYRLYKQDAHASMSLDGKLFPDFARKKVSWKSFCSECDERELTKYSNVINVVSLCQNQTLRAMKAFQIHVLDRRFSADEADIILTTCHSAKRMEWNNVHVCDDFIQFSTFKQNDAPFAP